jgi:excisionase family DNA binding protein
MTAMLGGLAKDYELVNRLLFTPEQAALALGIGRTRLYRLIADGALESMKLGRSRRIPRACLEEYVERQRLLAREGEP